MNSSEPVSMPARASAAQASGPWMARKTRSSASTVQSKSVGERLRRCASSAAALPALATTMKRSSPSRVTIRSSMMPACSLRKKVYFDCEIASAAASSGQARRAAPRRRGPDDLEQLHVRDVEQAGMLAGVQVLLHHAGRIGERHRPAGKGAKAGAGGDVQILEGKCLQVWSPVMTSPERTQSAANGGHPCPSV